MFHHTMPPTPLFHPLISHKRILPCSFATAKRLESDEKATAVMRPSGVAAVGQLR